MGLTTPPLEGLPLGSASHSISAWQEPCSGYLRCIDRSAHQLTQVGVLQVGQTCSIFHVWVALQWQEKVPEALRLCLLLKGEKRWRSHKCQEHKWTKETSWGDPAWFGFFFPPKKSFEGSTQHTCSLEITKLEIPSPSGGVPDLLGPRITH